MGASFLDLTVAAKHRLPAILEVVVLQADRVAFIAGYKVMAKSIDLSHFHG